MKAYRVIVEVNNVFMAEDADEAEVMALQQVQGDGFENVHVTGVWYIESGNHV